MPFTPKAWQDSPSTATPISAAALVDLENRVTAASVPLVSKDVASGVAGLDAAGLLKIPEMPPSYVKDVASGVAGLDAAGLLKVPELPAVVPLTNAANTFTQAQTFASTLIGTSTGLLLQNKGTGLSLDVQVGATPTSKFTVDSNGTLGVRAALNAANTATFFDGAGNAVITVLPAAQGFNIDTYGGATVDANAVLGVRPLAGKFGLVIKGAASQASNLLEVRSDTATLTSVGATGNVAILYGSLGVNIGGSTPDDVTKGNQLKLGSAPYGLRFGVQSSGSSFQATGVNKTAFDNSYYASTGNNNIVNHRVIEYGYPGNISWQFQNYAGVDGTLLALAEQFRLDASGVWAVAKIGFNGTAPLTKPAVTGSRGANAALASLLTALANYGLVTDSTTA